MNSPESPDSCQAINPRVLLDALERIEAGQYTAAELFGIAHGALAAFRAAQLAAAEGETLRKAHAPTQETSK